MHSHIYREKKVVVKSRFPLHGTPPPAASGGYLYTIAHSSFYCSKALRWRPPRRQWGLSVTLVRSGLRCVILFTEALSQKLPPLVLAPGTIAVASPGLSV